MEHSGRRRKRWGEIVAADLNVMPLMNLFIVLIPLLLLSAVFIEISVIEMNQSSSDEPPPQENREKLELAINISGDAYVVSGNGISSQTITRKPGTVMGSAADEAFWRQLSKALHQVTASHPDNQTVQIVAQESTLYEEIVKVMDVSREAGLPIAALVGRRNGTL